MSLAERLLKNSTIKLAAPLEESKVLVGLKNAPTKVPILNMALSGAFDKGIEGGLGRIAGESKSFKTMFGLVMVAGYMEKYPDSACLFFDSEFGAGFHYFKSMGIDMSRVVHIPIQNIEELKFEVVAQLENITRDDNVIIFVDSVGNLASKKEADDAKDAKSVADMTRAKALASFYRIVTPTLTIKDVPMITIDHVYSEQGLFPKTIVSGGQKAILSADWIMIVSKSQEKDGNDLVGWNFTLNVDKSRHVKEKSKFPVTVTYNKGINKWSGLLDIAIETGHVTKPKLGWYTRPSVPDDKLWRANATNCSDFWVPLFKSDFPQKASELYKVANTQMITDVVDVAPEEVADE